ncbi:MAG: alpha/beta fold hydrolase [Acidimicrobiia bacterium]|nr:alpha/beta fold hydrolase [Acidimicrobiia bacterium]MDH3398321.1 alpha/beta fold hydrolase [Acidimicrobiia bacterium]
MTTGPTASAALPPPGLDGLEAHWSQLVITPGLDGVGRTWHVLDNRVADPTVTLLCVHGNPTWSYLWRDLLANAPSTVRVVAMDQLDMGYSERTGTTRRFEQRIEDLGALTDTLELIGPVVTVAHDWGGPISLGWAERHRGQMAGIVLLNTAVQPPAGSPGPRLIRLVRIGGIVEKVCVATPTFIRGTMALARPRPARPIRAAYEAPYRSADRRIAIGAFVEDIPLSDDHPSRRAVDEVAAGLDQLAGVPALLLWGPSDPVFSDLYLRDLATRLSAAEIHRFEGAGHLVPEDADVATAVYTWLDRLDRPAEPTPPVRERAPMWAALDRQADNGEVAMVEMGSAGTQITFAQLHAEVRRVAGGLVELGVAKGARVALMVPPGIDLAVCVYACWRIGAVVVVADAGLGARGMSRALGSANPAYLIGIPGALAAARTLRWPGIRISTRPLAPATARLLKVRTTLDDLRRRGEGQPLPPPPTSLDEAGIGFTSGATGPAKGVAYRHHQLQAQRDALVDLYDIRSSDRLVAAFGPFALFGPAMGIPSVVPDAKVTAPGRLTARALAEAIQAVKATLVFASPAALSNVATTANGMSSEQATAMQGVRLVMSAGAPVPASVLRKVVELMPGAEAHTPYGMTEVLPVADISLAEIETAGPGNGVCVGLPVPGAEVAISPLAFSGDATGSLTCEGGVVGEVCIRAPHMRDGYDKLWVTHQAASQPPGWHRSGDVGHLDEAGRLWIEGRMGDVLMTQEGPVTPVGIEQAISTLPEVADAAAVGVGPAGTQQLVVVVVPIAHIRRPGLAAEALTDRIRAQAGRDVAAVLMTSTLPVDKRHNSKIDRPKIARWAEGVLAGGRIGQI